MIIFLSLKCFSLFLFGIFIGYLNTFPLEIAGGFEWHEYVHNGGARSMRTCAYDGGGGSNFCHSGAYVLLE